MHLQHEFYRFPFRFDAEALRREIEALPEDCWQFHHQNFKGNSALHLITTNGGINNDFDAPMMPTEHLARLPYTRQVLGSFPTLLGRARLMRLEPGDGVPVHSDLRYYWRRRTRVHIPVVTNPEIRFHCGRRDVHMAAGEAWTFDNWRMHKVVNQTSTRRIHLTFDTLGSSGFWALARPLGAPHEERPVPYREGYEPELAFETYVEPPVMSPSELDMEFFRFLSDIGAHPGNDKNTVAALRQLLLAFCDDWRVLWYGAGPLPENLDSFAAALERTAADAEALSPQRLVMASNGTAADQTLKSVFQAALKVSGARPAPVSVRALPRFERPVIIVSVPRSGSSVLFETLSVARGFRTLGGEGHRHVESIPSLAPGAPGIDSNRLTAEDASADVCTQLLKNYAADLRDADGKPWRAQEDPAGVRFLEKTPKNALRIPFLKAVFPDAKFIFLHREAMPNISSIMEAWRSGRFVTYPALPGWNGPPWSLALIPGWHELIGAPLGRIAVRQWRNINAIILDDLEAMPAADWCAVRYEQFIADPAQTVRRLCAFAEVEFDDRLAALASQPLKPSRYTLTRPDGDKWRRNEPEFAPYLAEARDTIDRLAALPAGRA